MVSSSSVGLCVSVRRRATKPGGTVSDGHDLARVELVLRLLGREPDELHVRADLVDRPVDVEGVAGDRDRRRQPVLVDERDARLRAREPGDEADEHGDQDRVRDQDPEQERRAPQHAQVLAQDQPGAPHASSAPPRTRPARPPGRGRRSAPRRGRRRGRRAARAPPGAGSRRRRRRRPPRRRGCAPRPRGGAAGRAPRSARRGAAPAGRRAARSRGSAAGGSRPRACRSGARRPAGRARPAAPSRRPRDRARPRAARTARGSRGP